MSLPGSGSDRYYSIYLALSQYPILSQRIRELMRQELYRSGMLTPQSMHNETTQLAILSQEKEGLRDPLSEEAPDIWDHRRAIVMDQLTDSYFAKFFSFEKLTHLIQLALSERGVDTPDVVVEFNPETAPLELLFNQGIMIENLSEEERAPYAARLHEIKVVLIRSIISDQLRYINIAKDWFTVSDLAQIRQHKMGRGRIGGKAAGMLLAARILKEKSSVQLKESLKTPISFYVGSDLFYTFLSINNLLHWNDQKYKSEEQMRKDYPLIQKDFESGVFTPSAIQHLETILSMAGNRPLIVRSSSLLEDNFGTAFAGKYESIFLPNQGKPEENLHALLKAMARIYATTLNPSALVYRKSRGLLDYDERMALLIQVVEGQQSGQYYFPQLAGVGYSRNQYRWSPQIKFEEGFVRLVWGLGTRAVDRVGNDYPRLVALSHPTLNPSSSSQAIRRYSQQYIDLIDLKRNEPLTLPVASVLNSQTPQLRYLAQIDSDGYIHSLRSNILEESPENLILTFHDLLTSSNFPALMREMLSTLEEEYATPVDVEFTAQIVEEKGSPQVQITLIQCRPLSTLKEGAYLIPQHITDLDKVFCAKSLVSGGSVEHIRFVVYVPPDAYFSIHSNADRYQLERAIGKLNTNLAKETFICIGPGRWGTSNPDLGIHVDYADIFNSRALVELSGGPIGVSAEPSLGTHFFQDLLEGQIYPLAINVEKHYFDQAFFKSTPNRLSEWVEGAQNLENLLKVIRVSDYRPNERLDLTMDDITGEALAYFVKNVDTAAMERETFVP